MKQNDKIKNILAKFFILILIFISNLTFGQRSGNDKTFFSNIGLKTGFGSSIVTNKNIKADNNINFNQVGTFYSYGLTGSINYIGMKPKNTIICIQAEFLRGNYSHYFSNITTETGINYTKNINYTIDNRIIIFRYENAQKKMFVGLGYKNSMFISVEEKNSILNSNFYSEKDNYNLVNFYKNYNSIIFDFGFNFSNLLISLRLSAPISEINKNNRSPIYDGVYSNQTINNTYLEKYADNKNTYQFTAEITLSYLIPFISYGRAKKSDKKLSIFKEIDKKYYWYK